MTDVPEYIMEAARECCAGFFTGHRELYVEDVARAMVALIERERRTAQGVTLHTGPMPMDGTIIHCRAFQSFRFKPYSPKSEQFRKGIKGRWQTPGEYGGWENCPAPVCLDWTDSDAVLVASLSTSAGGGERG